MAATPARLYHEVRCGRNGCKARVHHPATLAQCEALALARGWKRGERGGWKCPEHGEKA